MRKALCALTVAGLFSTAAVAGPVLEVEPNDSFDAAQVLPGDFFEPFGAGSVEGFLAADDVDYFKVDLTAGVLTTASIFDFTPDDGTDNDSLLGVFAPDGTLFDVDDDDGPGFLSSIHFFPPESGTWAFAVSGFGDDDFEGAHGEEYDYRLVLSIPEPATFGLMLVGAALVARKRRS
jgi:hypothetical protein